jgi:hypothetical protein
MRCDRSRRGPARPPCGGQAAGGTGDPEARRPKPLYLLAVDDPGERSIVLIVRTSQDCIQRATIVLPDWYELPAGWDGPHEMEIAVPQADSYAWEYCYRGTAIDIESSQLWNPAWGVLDIGSGAA